MPAAQRQMKRAGAGIHADRMCDVAVGRELLLQPRHFLAENILTALQYAAGSRADLRISRSWYSALIQKRNRVPSFALGLEPGCFPMQPRQAGRHRSTTFLAVR